MSRATLVIRADAGPTIGAGHVMRCVALAEAWQRLGGDVVFVCAELPTGIEKRLARQSFRISRICADVGSSKDLQETRNVADDVRAGWITLDGYRFDAGYQRSVVTEEQKLLIVDDYAHLNDYRFDCLLNQNVFARESLYSRCSSDAHLLLGSQYVLIRKEFSSWCDKPRKIPRTAKNVLVSLGGGDPENATLKVIDGLRKVKIPDMQAIIVVGSTNPHYTTLEKMSQSVRFRLQIKRHVSNMPELMAWADVAVSAGGSTCWELACMGLPHLTMVLADNQLPIVEALTKDDPELNLSWFHSCIESKIACRLTELMLDQSRRERLSNRGRNLIDGQGADRVARVLWNSNYN